MLAEAGKLVWSAGSTIVGVFVEKSKAEELYRFIVPDIQQDLRNGKSFESEKVVSGIKILEKLPPIGARRRSFSRRYLKRKTDFLALPQDPDALSIAYWW